MVRFLSTIYILIFSRPFFEKFNNLLFNLSINGLGILNYTNLKVSGERSFLKNYLPGKKGVIIDIGANEGKYCEEILKFNKKIRIYAFEPHPLTFQRLALHFEDHGNVTTINQGLSSEKGYFKLYDYPNNDGSSHASLYADVLIDIHGIKDAFSHEVSLTTLDTFVENQKIQEISLLKIDTEGNELEVLRGGILTLRNKKIKAIHFEFNEMNVASRSFFKDFWKILDEYEFYRMLPNCLLPIKKYNPITCELFAYQNIVAILKN